MNVLFLSPLFPPNAYLYCEALRQRGSHVIGIGDCAMSDATPRALRALDRYVCEPRMAEYDVLRGVVSNIIAASGPIDRLDSNGEHWLDTEGRLRDDFDVFGLRASDVARVRSKLAMARVFEEAGIQHPDGIRADSEVLVRQFARKYGFPLVFKPDVGSGAVDTFTVGSQVELDGVFARSLQHHIVQPFIRGDIVTFDGLVDASGCIVFFTSHVYDVGIMQLRLGQLDGYYYSLCVIPPGLESAGRKAVAAFGLRERFFHVEFFAREDGTFVALEMNVRPPGGFTTDMMGYACDIDIYALWAAVISRDSLANFSFERKYHTAHAGRRDGRRYALSHEELVRQLGSTLAVHQPIPKEVSATMGDHMYLLRTSSLGELREGVRLVQTRAA